MNKKLVCYFSATGTTERCAKKLSSYINGDLFEIRPTKKYSDADLDWTNENSRSTIEMKNDVKPSIEEKVSSINDYDTIYIGFPVWWYKEPTIIDAFIEENDLENKDVYVFVTSGSSSCDSSLENLRNKYKNIRFVSAKRITDDNDILEWIKE